MIANKIAQEIGEDRPGEIMATTLVAFALSSILTGELLLGSSRGLSFDAGLGLSFFILGALKLGAVIGFFPRHILIGCIGGIGAFLIETGYA